MKKNVLLFAAAKEAAGAAEVQIELPSSASVETLRATLLRDFPGLERFAGTLLIAVNSKYATDSQILGQDDQIACFPPVSGG
jgi:molybdopterin converting factor subunit 1